VLTKGWTANLDGYWQSGLAFGVTNGAAITGSHIVNGGLDQTCSGRLANSTKLQWINPACWSQPTISTYGDADGGQEFGPRQRNVDFSFFKTFDLTERFRLQFRTEVFNLLDMPDLQIQAGSRDRVWSVFRFHTSLLPAHRVLGRAVPVRPSPLDLKICRMAPSLRSTPTRTRGKFSLL
jgi:hypothetical protein